MLELSLSNVIAWIWSFVAAIALLAWLDGQSGWALAAAFNAVATVITSRMKRAPRE